MYNPRHFSADDLRTRKLISEHSFATLISTSETGTPFVNHLPMIFSAEPGKEDVIIGHMAKRNPQWRHFKEVPQALALFQGPHAYISPSWYRSGRDVPTWNYAVAHVHGRIELLEKCDDQIEILKQLTNYFENNRTKPWRFELPDDLLDEKSLTSAIISFRFHIERIESKFKLSQNRSEADQSGVIEGLGQSKADLDQGVRNMMLQNEK